jgi:ABC-2 type transport system permease protein
MREIVALAAKDLKLLVRDKAGFFFTFFFPLIVAIFFGAIFGGSDEGQYRLSVVLVDEDGSAASAAFVKDLAATSVLKATVASREDAVESVRRGRNAAYVIIKPGYGEASRRMFWGNPPEVELGIDPARRADAAMLEGVLMRQASQRFRDIMTDPAAQRANLDAARRSLSASPATPGVIRGNLEQLFDDLERFYTAAPSSDSSLAGSGASPGFEPVAIDRVDVGIKRAGPKNAYAITFPQGVIWGFIGVSAAFALSIVTERNAGTLMRLQVAPIGRVDILAGKALATFLTTVILATGLFALARLIFGVVPGSVALLAVAIVASAVAFVGIMMLLSVLGKTEQAASGVGWGVLLVFSMLGGGMIPYFIMPSWMRTLSNVSPVKWSILAMEGAVWRGFSPSEMLLPVGILVAVGVGFFAIGVRAFSWSSAK